MRLNELAGVKSLASKTPDDIIKALLEKGVFKKFLGQGVYGIAFQLSNDKVLKVWAGDPAFEGYVKYCAEHSKNPYLLKVFGKPRKLKTTLVDRDDEDDKGSLIELNFVRTELLQPITSSSQLGYDDSSKKVASILSNINFNVVYEGYSDDAQILDGSDDSLKHMGLDPTKSTEKFRSFIKNVYPILHHFRHVAGFELDLQVANIGLRGNQIVLLDPIVDAFGDGEIIRLEDLGIDFKHLK